MYCREEKESHKRIQIDKKVQKYNTIINKKTNKYKKKINSITDKALDKKPRKI